MPKDIQTLSNSIKKVIGGLEKKQADGRARIYSNWKAIVGDLFVRHCEPVDLKEGNLIINVENAAWMYMLRIKKAGVLEKIKEFSKEEIRGIRLRIGKVS